MADANKSSTGTPSGDPPPDPISGLIPSSSTGELSVNKSLSKQGYTGLASSIVNDHGIINLSSYAISDTEKRLLTKGLSFCPSRGECNLSKAREAIDKLHRSLRLTHFFNENGDMSDPGEDEGFSHRNFRLPSNWILAEFPPPTLASFITASNTTLSDLPLLRSKHNNLTTPEQEALKTLISNRNIVIKPADKGSGVVILNTNDYIHEAFRQLSDTSFYQPLEANDTSRISLEISNTLSNMRSNKEIDKNSLPSNQPKPLIWLRFIDDIFAIWTHGPEALQDFTTWLNARHTNIKFTCSHSETSVTFLDTTVLLKDDHLETELFIKPTSSLSYLHRNSSHPTHVFSSLPYGEFLRVRRNCSTLESFDHFSEIILEAFIHRGYDRASLDRARQQARTKDRSSLLETYANLQASNETDPEIADSSTKNFYLILQHHVENTKIKQLLRKNWTILGSSDLTSSLFQSRLICGASRNPRLRDMLVRSSLPLNPQFGKTGKSQNICTNTSCKYCHSLDTTGQIRSNKLGRNFPSKHSVCCKSHNLVYCLTCNICGLQYVGQTKRTFHLRLYEHFRDIQKLDLSKPLGRHSTLPNHTPDVNHITSHILAFITKPSNTSAAQQMRLKFEREWIYRLRTNLPHGLNAMD